MIANFPLSDMRNQKLFLRLPKIVLWFSEFTPKISLKNTYWLQRYFNLKRPAKSKEKSKKLILCQL
jgi:hypothetical protein